MVGNEIVWFRKSVISCFSSFVMPLTSKIDLGKLDAINGDLCQAIGTTKAERRQQACNEAHMSVVSGVKDSLKSSFELILIREASIVDGRLYVIQSSNQVGRRLLVLCWRRLNVLECALEL